MNKRYKVLHIVPHMGAGVGRALYSLTSNSVIYGSTYSHEIILLEDQVNKQSYNQCISEGIKIDVVSDINTIRERMETADIIQVEWWHHPLISKFLANIPQIPIRLIMWCHISGTNYPLIPFSMVKRPHKFIFTSPCSWDNPSWTSAERVEVEKITEVINSNGNLDKFLNIDRIAHQGFRIGYVGTQNYCRLHPEFINYCKEVKLEDSVFVMAGDNTNIKDISDMAMKEGILEKFEFLGYVDEVEKVLAELDVFAYPMNPQHYGTTENAIIEAMAAGIPVVLLNQCCEKYIVKHNETGLLVDSIEEYGKAIRFLRNNLEEANRLGQNAKKFIKDKYKSNTKIEQFTNVYNEVIAKEKEIFNFTDIIGEMPYEWILNFMDSEKILFKESIILKDSSRYDEIYINENRIANARRILREPTKFSIRHYNGYFTEDPWLSYWVDIFDRIPFVDNLSKE